MSWDQPTNVDMEKFQQHYFNRKKKICFKRDDTSENLITHTFLDSNKSNDITDLIQLRTESLVLRWISKEMQLFLKSDNQYSEEKLYAATKKLSRFLYGLGELFERSQLSIHIDDFIEDSIVLRFKRECDIRVNIYFNEDLEYESEECYLSFRQNGKRIVEANNINNITKFLKKLL